MIDWDRINQLRSEIGAEDFADVVALFLGESDDVIAGLAGLQGPRAVESALHFLKGSALNLGFADLARLCQDGERRAATGDGGVDLAEVARVYDASKSAFECGLDQPGGSRAA